MARETPFVGKTVVVRQLTVREVAQFEATMETPTGGTAPFKLTWLS